MALAEDLDVIEKSIRRIQIEWEKFFGGVEKKPPNELKVKLEAMIRRYGNEEIRNNTERFRMQTLTARYNTFNELWQKRLRAIEEGKPLGVHGLKADLLPAKPAGTATGAAGAVAAARAAGSSEVRVRSPQGDVTEVKALYDRFLEERKRTGETAAVKFESFQKLIAQQAARILTEKGASAVDFRLETKDGKVSLKAKAVK